MNRCDHTGRRAGVERRCIRAPHSDSLHTYTRLAEVSPGRRVQMVDYRELRREFLATHPRCEFPGCGARSEVVHHSRGREGERLLLVEFWRASCVPHNDFAETRTGEALALGWLIRIEGIGAA